MLKRRLYEIGKQLFYLAWECTPSFIQEWVKKKHANKTAAKETEIFLSNAVSEQDVADAFAVLDMKGDVLVHSSLIHIGNIKGRHKPIVKALQEYILDKGNTVLGIAIPIKGSSQAYLKSISRFDKNEPIAMGVISTYYAKQDGACRSLNPTHSVVAYGPRAEEYTATHHLDKTPFTEKSPYYKLLEHNGSVLMVGAAIKHLTLAHVAEDMLGDLFPRNIYTKEEYPVDIYRNEECIYHGKYKAHSIVKGILCVPDYVYAEIKKLPSTKVVPLGASELLYINAREAVICELQELRKGNSIYGWCPINKECRERIDYWINKIKNMPNE